MVGSRIELMKGMGGLREGSVEFGDEEGGAEGLAVSAGLSVPGKVQDRKDS